jgi:hypothetical protein
MGERIGQITVALSVALLAMFFTVAIRKGDRTSIIQGKTFAVSAVTTFVSNGITFAGQMLMRWLPSSEQFPRFDKCHSTGFEGCGNFMRRPRRVAG